MELHADELLGRQSSPPESKRQTQLELASDWLWVELSAGERAVPEVLAAGKSEGFSERTLQRAFNQLGGVTLKGPDGHWVWRLPVSDAPAA